MTNETGSVKREICCADAVRSAAQRVMQRCEALAGCTDQPGEIARFFCSPAMTAAHRLVGEWMRSAGLHHRMDAAGNLIGHWVPEHLQRYKRLLLGSHLDTVANAGKYDGVLGVLLGIAVAELATKSDIDLPFAIYVLGFSEEEGVRYQTPFIGSRAIVGELNDELLNHHDAERIAMIDALRRFGCDTEKLTNVGYFADDVLAYIEPHIEQGPMLDAQNLPVGIVTAITGQTRARFRFTGHAGHAGAVPMAARQDALVAAAVFIAEVERLARERSGLVATVGKVEVRPNVSNVIPGEVDVWVDVRHQDDDARDAAFREITHQAALIAEQREIDFDLDQAQSFRAVHCDPSFRELMAASVAEAGVRPFELPSGAGHDAAIMSRRFPVGMLFVRCAGGVSHHPDESVAEGDVTVALEVLWRFVVKLAARHSSEIKNNTY
jgi:allantoate deiminase